MSQLHLGLLLHRISLPQSSFLFRFPPLLRRRADFSPNKSTESTIFHPLKFASSRIACRNSSSDITPQFELDKSQDKRKPLKRPNGIFWIMLINLGIFVADHIFQVRSIESLYFDHNSPAWYQFVTATFCHINWNHLAQNLPYLYIFGKRVEEEEGNFVLWLSYLFTGVGAKLISWLVLPRDIVSLGASGAVCGLFAISFLIKMSRDWRKILEDLILVKVAVGRAMEVEEALDALVGTKLGGYSLYRVNHIAHLSGVLFGVVFVWLLSKFPSRHLDKDVIPTTPRK